MKIAAVAVFCGSRLGSHPAYSEAARLLGRRLAEKNVRLVYGGGNVGLMGLVADAVLAAGGEVKGVIPHFLHEKEGMHRGVNDLVVTSSMHERKELMYQNSDAFLVLPGGLGTFDELMEVVTWRQLHLHDKPIVIININDWARHLIAALLATIEQGLADASARGLFSVASTIPEALVQLGLSDQASQVSALA